MDLYRSYSIYNPGYQLVLGNLALFDIRKKEFIYVINHGLNSKDGERIEVFEIIKENNKVSYFILLLWISLLIYY